ncbi:hypothetical protein Tco_0088475 [Tanacetum coccineum]
MVEGVMIVMPNTSAKDKGQIRLEVKDRSTLMMGIPNKHQLKFNSFKDAKFCEEYNKEATVMVNDTIGFDKSKVECYNSIRGDILLGSAKLQEIKTQEQGKLKKMCKWKHLLPQLVSCDVFDGYDWSGSRQWKRA